MKQGCAISQRSQRVVWNLCFGLQSRSYRGILNRKVKLKTDII